MLSNKLIYLIRLSLPSHPVCSPIARLSRRSILSFMSFKIKIVMICKKVTATPAKNRPISRVCVPIPAPFLGRFGLDDLLHAQNLFPGKRRAAIERLSVVLAGVAVAEMHAIMFPRFRRETRAVKDRRFRYRL